MRKGCDLSLGEKLNIPKKYDDLLKWASDKQLVSWTCLKVYLVGCWKVHKKSEMHYWQMRVQIAKDKGSVKKRKLKRFWNSGLQKWEKKMPELQYHCCASKPKNSRTKWAKMILYIYDVYIFLFMCLPPYWLIRLIDSNAWIPKWVQ